MVRMAPGSDRQTIAAVKAAYSRFNPGMAFEYNFLAAFTAQRRKKEIGIRKVVGASVAQLVFLLSKEFLGLVLLAIGIAVPLAWLGMRQWLDQFAYRVPLTAGIFAVTGLTAIVITLLTISYQSISAAMSNPVHSLRSE
jgi:putative ABC transport system permease protein